MSESLRQKLIDMANNRANLLDEAEAAIDADNQEAYDAAMAKYSALEGQMRRVQDLIEAQDKSVVAPDANQRETPANGAPSPGYEKAVHDFAQAARAGFPSVRNAAGDFMQEGVDADGGYTVPPDIVTRIIKLRESKESLLDLVTITNVKTPSGRRTLQTRQQAPVFMTVEEAAQVGKLASPQFTTKTYTIKKRGGYMVVTNELLADSDNNIVAVAQEWLADANRNTANKMILDQIKTSTAKDLANLDGILGAWVGLGSVFRPTSQVVTNDDGLLYLGTLKDKNERYLLTPNPADPKQLRLCVGPYTLPVKTYDNKAIPTEEGKVPMILGDLKEGIMYWDRRLMSILVSNTASVGDVNAFEQDLTLWRGLVRSDCTIWDDKAFVNGYITVASGASAAAAASEASAAAAASEASAAAALSAKSKV